MLDAIEKRQWPNMNLIIAMTMSRGTRVCGSESALEREPEKQR